MTWICRTARGQAGQATRGRKGGAWLASRARSGRARSLTDRIGRYGFDRSATVASTWQGRRGSSARGADRIGAGWRAWGGLGGEGLTGRRGGPGLAWFAWSGQAGVAWNPGASLPAARQARQREVRGREARSCRRGHAREAAGRTAGKGRVVSHGGPERLGGAWLGRLRSGRRGMVRLGCGWHGRHGLVRWRVATPAVAGRAPDGDLGLAGIDEALNGRQRDVRGGLEGLARSRSAGLARSDQASRGMAWPARRRRIGRSRAWPAWSGLATVERKGQAGMARAAREVWTGAAGAGRLGRRRLARLAAQGPIGLSGRGWHGPAGKVRGGRQRVAWLESDRAGWHGWHGWQGAVVTAFPGWQLRARFRGARHGRHGTGGCAGIRWRGTGSRVRTGWRGEAATGPGAAPGGTAGKGWHGRIGGPGAAGEVPQGSVGKAWPAKRDGRVRGEARQAWRHKDRKAWPGSARIGRLGTDG